MAPVAESLGWGLGLWALTSLMVLGAGGFGWMHVMSPGDRAETMLESFSNWDGFWYSSIVDYNYTFDPNEWSSVAFFPAYPVLAQWVMQLSGCSTRLALLIVSQTSLAIGFVVFHAYLRRRFGHLHAQFAPTALVLFALFPPTFFARFTYSEGLFICLVAVTLLAVECRWPLVVLAAIVGAATAARPVGVALVPVLAREIWLRSPSGIGLVWRCGLLLPLSMWGLIAYAIHLDWKFGDPLLFVKAQQAWNMHPGTPFSEKAQCLLTLQPLWGTFVDPVDSGVFMIEKTLGSTRSNACVFLFGVFLVGLGAWKRWLNWPERLAAIGLLAIPYVTRAYEGQFASFARFTSVVLPIYISMTFIFLRLPRFFQWAYLSISVFMIVLLSALFTAGFGLI